MGLLLGASLEAAPACDGATLRTSPGAAFVGLVWGRFGGGEERGGVVVVRGSGGGGGGGGNGGSAAATAVAAIAAVLVEVAAPSVLPKALPCKLEELPKAAARRMRGTAGEATYGEAGVEAIEAVAIESEARVARPGSPPAASPEPSSVAASRGAGCAGCVAGLTASGAQMALGA